MVIRARQGGPISSIGTGSESGTTPLTSTNNRNIIVSGSTSSSASVTTTSDILTGITETSSSASSSTTSDTPSTTAAGGNTSQLRSSKNAVEGALVVVAAVVLIALILWRIFCLRRGRRSIRDFFSPNPQPDTPPRPRVVPRTTGLPPASAPPAHTIYDYLTMPMPVLLNGEQQRRRHGRRTRAGDVDTGGRRGPVAHPDDPYEFLPKYDDKDALPKYQDLERAGAGMSPNGSGGTNDTIPLVTRMQLPSNVTVEDTHNGARGTPLASAGSSLGHEIDQVSVSPHHRND